MTTRRTTALALAALAAGLAIAFVDASPGWDSTGITAVALVGSAGTAAALAGGRRPWLWALLVGLPTPILEIVRYGNSGSVLALGFATLGAFAGWAIGRSGAATDR